MKVFDYLAMFVLACSVLMSTLCGLVKEILSLLSWIIAFFITNDYGETLASWLPQMIKGNTLRLIVLFLALFVGVRILMRFLSMLLDAVIKADSLTLAFATAIVE